MKNKLYIQDSQVEPVAFECVPGPDSIGSRLLDAARPHEEAIGTVVNEPASYFNQDARDCDVYSIYLKPGWRFSDGTHYYSHVDAATLIDALADGCVMPESTPQMDDRMELMLGQLALQLDEEGRL